MKDLPDSECEDDIWGLECECQDDIWGQECECEDDIWGQVSESVKMAFGDR